MGELDRSGIFKEIEHATCALQALGKSAILNDALSQAPKNITIEEPLVQLVSHDNERLAEEAAVLLEKRGPAKCGFAPPRTPDSTLTSTVWEGELGWSVLSRRPNKNEESLPSAPVVGPSEAQRTKEGNTGPTVDSQTGPRIQVVDYGDSLFFTNDHVQSARTLLGLEEGEAEIKQCVLLSIVGSALWALAGSKDPPTMQEVQEATMKARWEVFHAATDADGALGQAPALLTTAEGNLRVFTHDVLYPHHDKDVRSLAPYPISLLKNVEVAL